ncbi:MAG: hypothetical protein DIU69_02065 [Bacillota bacterium]|nr:MAG: hypothetical protein DIU69_02065 [Bacillota bacterium]
MSAILGLALLVGVAFWRLAAGGQGWPGPVPEGRGSRLEVLSLTTMSAVHPVDAAREAQDEAAVGGAGTGKADAFATAVQHISYRLERLDPAQLGGDLGRLNLELATPGMPFVSAALAASGSGDGVPAGKGELPPVLLIAFGPRFPETAGHVIATWDDQGVRLQVIDERVPPGPAADGREAGAAKPRFGLATVFRSARVWRAGEGGNLELAVVAEKYPGTPQSEQALFLLRREDREWRLLWATGGEEWPGAARQIVLGDDLRWFVAIFAGDGQGRAGGPGRVPVLVTPEGFGSGLLQQRWERRGDGYVPVASMSVAQPAAVLEEFIVRLSRGDRDAAGKLVQDPALVERGEQLLSQRPLGQAWLVQAAGDSYLRGPLVVTRRDGQRVTVYFSDAAGLEPVAGRELLITDIVAGGR